MKRRSAFAKTSLAAFIVSCALLVGLFTFPHYYIQNTQQQLAPVLTTLTDSIGSEDSERWRTDIDTVTAILEPRIPVMKLFVHHQYTYDLDMSLNRLRGFAEAEDAAESLGEIQSIKKQIEYLLSIETFDLHNLF